MREKYKENYHFEAANNLLDSEPFSNQWKTMNWSYNIDWVQSCNLFSHTCVIFDLLVLIKMYWGVRFLGSKDAKIKLFRLD